MTTLISPSVPPSERDPGGAGSPGRESAAARAGQPARYHPGAGSGVRNGLVRTRTIRSNTQRALARLREDRGAATAEYIVATMAIVGAKRRKSFQTRF